MQIPNKTVMPTRLRVMSSDTTEGMYVYVEFFDSKTGLAQSITIELGWQEAVGLMHAIREVVTIPQ